MGLGEAEIMLLVMFLLAILLWVVALVDITRSEFESGHNKIVWILIVLLAPFLGVILYFIFGTKQKIKK